MFIDTNNDGKRNYFSLNSYHGNQYYVCSANGKKSRLPKSKVLCQMERVKLMRL